MATYTPLYSFGFGQRIIGWVIIADGSELATVRTRREARNVVRLINA